VTLDYEIACEFTDLERGVEEMSTLGFAARNDVEYECESHASVLGARYGIAPKRRGAWRWEIREPGSLLVVVKANRIIEASS
jgi:hypothetical protein